MRSLVMLMVLIAISSSTALGQSDSLIVGSVLLGHGDNLRVPVTLIYGSGVCTAKGSIRWQSTDDGLVPSGIIAGDPKWNFTADIDLEGREIAFDGRRAESLEPGRAIGFYIELTLKKSNPMVAEFALGHKTPLVFGDCAGLAQSNPGFMCGNLRIANSILGDANSSGVVNGIDILYIVNYLRGTGPAPAALTGGDVNGSCVIDGQDVSYLVNYMKARGPAPFGGNCQ